ncbi:MAG: DsbA family protein [Acidimicrobiales bacterium]
MAAPSPTAVDFHFDVMCPYAYQTSLWMREVRDLAGIDVTWRFFSLEEVNRVEGKKHPWEREWSYGWSMMRIGARLRREDPALLDEWYLRAGTALHVDGRKPHRPEVAEALLVEMGLDPGLVREAIDDPTTTEEVRAEHERVLELGGWSPVLVFEGDHALRPGGDRPAHRRRRAAPLGARHRLDRVPARLRAPAPQAARRHRLIPPSAPTSRPVTGPPSRQTPDAAIRERAATSQPAAPPARHRQLPTRLDDVIHRPPASPAGRCRTTGPAGAEEVCSSAQRPSPDIGHLTHLRNDIATMNEAWVEDKRRLSGPEVLEQFGPPPPLGSRPSAR